MQQAIAICAEKLQTLRDGGDVRRQKKQKAEVETETIQTVSSLVSEWAEFAKKDWSKSPDKASTGAMSRIRKYILPVIGDCVPSEVTSAQIAEILNPLYVNHPATADKVNTLCHKFFRWCQVGKELIAIDKRLPTDNELLKDLTTPKKARAKPHHQAMCPVEDLPRFIRLLVSSSAWHHMHVPQSLPSSMALQ